jgi:transcriptional regulator with XRE-family HTH domain
MMFMSEQKKKGGRPSKYHTHIEPYLEHIAQMRRNGLTLEQIAERFNVSLTSIMEYQRNIPQFANVLKENAELAIIAVENALFRNAVHHNNLAAQIFILKNRASNKWRDKQHIFQQSTVTQKMDWEHVSDEDLEKMEQELDTVEIGEHEPFESDGEIH